MPSAGSCSGALPAGLSLVPIAAEHAATVVRWRMDPRNRPLFLTADAITVTSQLAWTVRASADVTDLTCVALLAGGPVGMVALYRVERGEAEYGRVLVDARHRRLGIGGAVSGMIIAHGFARLGLRCIHADCLAGNDPGQRLLASLGFARCGVWRREPSGPEVVRLGLDRRAWARAAMGTPYERHLDQVLARTVTTKCAPWAPAQAGAAASTMET